MQFDIQFDIAASFALFVVFVHVLLVNRDAVYIQSKVFLSFLLVLFASSALDILGTITLSNADLVPLWANYAVNTAYLVTQFLLPSLLSSYLFIVMRRTSKQDFRAYFFLAIPSVIGIIALVIFNYSTGCFFYLDINNVYCHGFLHPFFYINGLYCIIFAGTIAFKNRAEIPSTQFYTIILVIFLNVVVLPIQFFMPRYLLTSFAGALSVVLMYLGLQNYEGEADSVTGIASKRAFYHITQTMLRKNKSKSYLIVYMDICHFKVVNDLFSVATGDAILTRIASILKNASGTTGTCGRIEGDHFVMCIPENEFKLEELLYLTRKEAFYDLIEYDLRILCGMYVIDDITIPVELMCDRAQLAQQPLHVRYDQRAKYYDNELRNLLAGEQEIINAMEQALINGEYEVYYQPIFGAGTDTIIALESLVRWNHPQKGLLQAKDFIPLYEKKGSVVLIDQLVLRLVCSQMHEWKEQGIEPLVVTVNISSMSRSNGTFCDEVFALVSEYDIDPAKLVFEINEACYIQDSNTLIKTMEELRDKGFKIALDNFGKGYSSLNVLKESPFDYLKIDMDFYLANDSQRSVAIVEAIASMVQAMGLSIVAEGVDSIETAQIIQRIGCDGTQGYHYAHPMSANQAAQLMLR